jgi:hypothetical protein
MIFFGDLYQLPPIITREEQSIFKTVYSTGFFFSARVMKKVDLKIITLKKIYRQSNQEFIRILNRIRNNNISKELLEKINENYYPKFIPNRDDFFIYLTTRNIQAKIINERKLQKLDTKECSSYAFVEGDFTKNSLPADEILKLKTGAQVMFLNNDPEGRWINGTMGEVKEIHLQEEFIKVLIIEKNQIVDVFMHRWDLVKYVYDVNSQKIETEIAGSFHQFPLRLAWAVTIHKSQGKTFQKVIVDIGRGAFCPGQLYVALSRCTNLENIILKERIRKRDILTDHDVVNFLSTHCLDTSIDGPQISNQDKIKFLEDAIRKKSRVTLSYEDSRGRISTRTIKPVFVGELKYADNNYLGVTAFCFLRNENRNFNIDRILEIIVADEPEMKNDPTSPLKPT